MSYIENALIVKLNELPKIGDIDAYHNGVVYSLSAYENENYPDYIFYKVEYSERLTAENIKYFMFGADSYSFTYAVKIFINLVIRNTDNSQINFFKLFCTDVILYHKI